MAAMLPTTGHELDEVRALELIFAEESLRCRGFNRNGCQNAAEYQILCPCKEGSSHQCGSCLAHLQANAVDGGVLAFFGPTGCGHTVEYAECTILPI